MDAREQILNAATHLFAARGYDGTSLGRISTEVGIRKASLLYHFASKDVLHRAVLDRVLSHWNEALPRILEAVTGEDRFDALLREVIHFFAADPNRARLILREALDRPDAIHEQLRSQVGPWITVIAGFIRRGQESGELRADADPEAYLLQVIHLIVGGVATADTLTMRNDPARLLREIERVAKVSLFTDEGLARQAARGEEAAQ
ncbi:MAG: TetR/AcrR family transcriptional regulator [Sandaracinaceae bacterium]